MIENLQEYFCPEMRIFLDVVNYKRIEEHCTERKQEISLLCQDNVNVSVNEDGVRVIVTRSVIFDPNEIFTLSVSFGADLKFTDRKLEYEWKDLDLAQEFMENGDFVTAQLMSRISLVIGEITSSFGQQPLILPAVIAKKDGSETK